METIKLKTIEEEAADCRAAFALAGSEIGDLVNFCHHEDIIENLSEPAEERIMYILEDKPLHEQALRLRLFRPIVGAEYLDYGYVMALKALTTALLYYREQYDEGNVDYTTLNGLRRAYRVIRKEALKDYPFEELFGAKWEDDIFSTFPFENHDEYAG